VDNQLLLPTGTTLSATALRELILSNKTDYQSYSLLGYGSIKKDLLYYLSLPPYKTIFSNKDETAEIIEFIENVVLVQPVLQSLDYFKRYDFHTYRHSLIVFALSILLARILRIDYKDLLLETTAGPTHDLGKICVPLRILRKREPLTRAEHEILKHHTIAGYVLLSYYLQNSRSITAKLARDHHERRNASGYPRGIRQRNQLVEIVAVSDIYDALISPRPYRPTPYENRTALEELTSMAERNEISWETVRALIAYNRKEKSHYRRIKISTEKRTTPPSDNVYGVIVEKD